MRKWITMIAAMFAIAAFAVPAAFAHVNKDFHDNTVTATQAENCNADGLTVVTFTSTTYADEGYTFTGISPITKTYPGDTTGTQYVTVTLTETSDHFHYVWQDHKWVKVYDTKTTQVRVKFTLTECVVPTPPKTLIPVEPNADAFCYGVGADSFVWIMPSEFAYLTQALADPVLDSHSQIIGWKPYWTYGAVANATKGVDPSGVMQNGMRPTCAKGTPTGQFVDNQGWWTLSGLDVFAGIVNPQGTKTVPEHYQVVTVP